MISRILNLLFPPRFRTPAELPAAQWLAYRHGMLVDYSTRKAWGAK